ncbi:hypothetical protein Y032_0188g1162 [Ancylostoma ceylanicum]|uniref:Uncharacterized protein n=1 Tax=Ancylostoma ceylanicum TaxID=53326 RepID=A0A016SRM5_9BILA|nr:hypothetical protein Y032_0188g1162 [Ancylostoma ceylanicum]
MIDCHCKFQFSENSGPPEQVVQSDLKLARPKPLVDNLQTKQSLALQVVNKLGADNLSTSKSESNFSISVGSNKFQMRSDNCF